MKQHLLVKLSEADFLKKLAVGMYNDQYNKKMNIDDFCVMSIDPGQHFRLAYEVITLIESDFLRLKMYFNFGHKQKFHKYKVEVTSPFSDGDLKDEVLVTTGTLESYYLDDGIYKFREINTCGISNLLTEDGEDIITEDGDDIVIE